ncbi:MAG: hypothetical protein Q7K45_02835 [Nanoarchaeota archaeon]|nr:hypothetical protein [Nanoarchaeota archaeon]
MSIIKTHPLLLAVLLLLVVSSVSAAIEVVESTGINLSVDYHDFDRNSQPNIPKTVQFTVRNTGTENVTIQTATTGLPSGYSATSVANTLVNAGSTATIAFNLNIPHQKGSGTETIGTIILTNTATSTELSRVSLIQSTKSMLELNEVRVDYTDEDDESQRDDYDRNDQVFDLENKVLIGTEVTVKFDIKNLFHKDYDDDGTLEDIELSFDVDDSDLYQEDIDDEYTFNDVDADGEDTLTVTFIVSEQAESKDYDIDITIQADDGNNAVHKVERTLTLTVERKKDDVRITKAVIAPATITTCDTSFTLDATLSNLGKSRQRNVVFSIFNQKLGIDVKQSSIELDPFDNGDDTFSKKFTFPLRNPPVGKQILTLKAVNDKQLDSEPVEVTIGACATAPAVEDDEEVVEEPETNQPAAGTATGTINTGASAGNSNQGTTADAQVITSSAIVETIENPWTKEDMLIGLFIIAIIMTLALIIIFFIILLK